MKTFTLIRHGEPEIMSTEKAFSIKSGSQIGPLIKAYDLCGVVFGRHDTSELPEIIRNADFVLSSSLRRTQDSLRMLGCEKFTSMEIFDEAHLPWQMPSWIRLPVAIWALFLRLIWAVGYRSNCESIAHFKERMNKAAYIIEKLFQEHQNIVLLGHGLVNLTLSRILINREGWRCASGKPFLGSYWSKTCLYKE
jgi:broad specificity phosphatase PhoE